MPHVGPNIEFIIHAYVPREYPMHPLSQDEEMANPDPAKDRYTTFFSQAHIWVSNSFNPYIYIYTIGHMGRRMTKRKKTLQHLRRHEPRTHNIYKRSQALFELLQPILANWAGGCQKGRTTFNPTCFDTTRGLINYFWNFEFDIDVFLLDINSIYFSGTNHMCLASRRPSRTRRPLLKLLMTQKLRREIVWAKNLKHIYIYICMYSAIIC